MQLDELQTELLQSRANLKDQRQNIFSKIDLLIQQANTSKETIEASQPADNVSKVFQHNTQMQLEQKQLRSVILTGQKTQKEIVKQNINYYSILTQ